MAETMRVVEISQPGGPEVLKPGTAPIPEPGPGEILIRIRAAGVNRPDAMQRAGAYDPPPDASPLPGLEAAGEVAAVGVDVNRWAVGDAVTALLPGGGYAEYAVCPADHALPKPERLSWEEAAALCETAFTVWINVFERVSLLEGESFLVHGGSSGIGTMAIQLAKARGARVFATAGTLEKCAACERLGAERAINYREEDFVAVVRDATEGRGVDVILDMVGGPYLKRDVAALAPDGRLSMIAFLGGPKAELNFAAAMAKRLTITGSTLRPRSIAYKAHVARTLEREIWPLIESGEIGPVMDRTFPLEEAAAAHARMEASEHIGKIVLVP
ncbi:MAG: NAD(P)H-quinone oxidoreductase [Rubricella sp.]